GPYYLGGFSFGAKVAFEMAQQLQAGGKAVGLLAIIDQWAYPGATRFRLGFLGTFLRNVPSWVRYDLLQTEPKALRTRIRLGARAMLRRFSRALNPHGGPPRSASEEAGAVFDLARLPEPLRGLTQHHSQVQLDYEPRPYPGRVTVLR